MKQETARVPRRVNPTISVSSLPFSEIPGQSRLFLDYLRDPVSLRKYYPNAVASAVDVAAFAPEVLANYRTDRLALSDALVRMNTAFVAGDATIANARRLSEPDTVAVVTGQQAGLFTGPLYTIYKALSVIRTAEQLNTKGTKAVPVFWVATEDHDFDEVAETAFVGRDSEALRVGYRPSTYLQNSPVGAVALDDRITAVLDTLFARLPETEFSAAAHGLLANAWSPDAAFGASFARTLIQLLGKFGLVVVDPLDADIKRLAAPIYEKAVRTADEIITAVRERSSELEAAGYHAQVVVDADHFPLFWHNDAGQRIALRKTDDGRYRAKDGSREFTLDELASLARDEPQRFSPGVMLRPVVQDYLLPTVRYFGGAAEVAYFAQNSEVYRILERPATPIFHRQSFTIVTPKQRRNLDKLDLKLNDLFRGRQQLLLDAAGDGNDGTRKLFADVEDEIKAELDRIERELSAIDPTLAGNLETRRRKVLYHIAALSKKALIARSRRDGTTVRQVDGLLAVLLPWGGLQERSLNVFNYLNLFGMNFIDWLYEGVDLRDKDHRVIDL